MITRNSVLLITPASACVLGDSFGVKYSDI